ncbi:MAG: 50S ribosomal protein L3 N(5)-glutamine methyltransferase [Wenzhouxiangella sp.]
MASESDLRLADLVQAAAERMEAAGLFFGHGTDNALDEACWLAAAVLELPPDFSPEAFETSVPEVAQARYETLLQERIETAKPLAYVLGEAWLAGLKFRVGPEVLVPRSPLAELLVGGFEPWLETGQLKRAVDVGTGSGCLAIVLAHYHPDVRVDAVDVSDEALRLAEENRRLHGLADRVRLFRSDLLCDLPEGLYDLILANPPYVPEASMAELPREFLWEPRLGLVGGADGLDLVRRLIVQAADRLSDHGILVCEVGEAAEALDTWLAAEPVTWLEFAHGGDGVFLLDRSSCRRIAART